MSNETRLFSELGLDSMILKNLESISYHQMTPIQAATLPIALSGRDIIAQAKTGSGKTAAFGLTILSKLDIKFFRAQALILCPTRELADQVAVELRKLARFTQNVKILPIYGGVSEHYQERSLEHGAHIIVGTPGRIVKMIKKRSLILDNITTFVLDEADRMLQMGFQEDLTFIERELSKNRQTLLFSATFPNEIEELSAHIQKEAALIKVDERIAEGVISQYFYDVGSHKNKVASLQKILATFQPSSAIIYCKTKIICDALENELRKQGILAHAIHGDLEQRDRTRILTKFSNKSCPILIATDVASRGLDIKNLELVINFDLTTDPEVYVHRIGRTGRAGLAGHAVSLVVPQEEEVIQRISEYTDTVIEILDIENLQPELPYVFTPPMATILIHGGRKDKMRPGDILGALTKEGGLLASEIGNINIHDLYSFVAIETSKLTKAAMHLENEKVKGKRFHIEKI